MKMRYKHNHTECSSSRFNTMSLNEVLTEDDSVYISDLDVYIKGKWKDLGKAFRDKDIIPDNYNTWFAEPKTQEEKDRGYFE